MKVEWKGLTRTVVLVAMAAICGCSEKATDSTGATLDLGAPKATASTELKPVNPEDASEAQEQARLAVIAAMRRGDPPPPPGRKLRGGESATPEVLEAYNLELLRVRLQERRSPETLEDLKRKWITQWKVLPRLPTPPRGKKLVYDDVNCIIRLEDISQ